MRTFSLSQIILFFIFCCLLFGDLENFKKKFKIFVKQIQQFFENKN